MLRGSTCITVGKRTTLLSMAESMYVVQALANYARFSKHSMLLALLVLWVCYAQFNAKMSDCATFYAVYAHSKNGLVSRACTLKLGCKQSRIILEIV